MAAIGNTVNPRVPTTLSVTDNTKLPVSFLPAEIFGGPAGTFREITLGQEYITSFTIAPQLDIVNAGAIAKVKSAKISEEITVTNGLLTQKNLLESVAACYHNILSMKAQQRVLEKNFQIADSIAILVENRYQAGLARSQERNETAVNKLAIRDKIEQLDYLIENQHLMLQILCDIDAKTKLVITAELPATDTLNIQPTASSQLQVRYWQLQKAFAKAELKAAYWSHTPTLSFVSSISWQNNSNNNDVSMIRFFDLHIAT